MGLAQQTKLRQFCQRNSWSWSLRQTIETTVSFFLEATGRVRRTMMTNLKALGWALNSPVEDELTRAAARTVLGASDPLMIISALFPILMAQKGIRAAIGHLSRAGADLEELSIPTAMVCNTFPMSRQRLWPIPSGPRWTLAYCRCRCYPSRG